jgi:beta-glucosidase
MESIREFTLPQSLLLGSATAATQIEGGDYNCNWYTWSLAGKVGKPGKNESSITGADHWNRWKEDVELLSALGHECYRMGIEWSRIEPREGEWSTEAIAHYREEIGLLREKGIVPLVTLHHFSCPEWFQKKDGWLSPDAVDCFMRFVEYAVRELGDLVGEWCTINEPNVFANDTYVDAHYPGARNGDIGAYFRASRALIVAHLRTYKAIHRIRKERNFSGETKVGFAHHLAIFEPCDGHPLARFGCALQDYLFHEIYFRGFVEGRLVFPLGHGHPEGKSDAPHGRFCDYIGINYYSRHLFRKSWKAAPLFAVPIVDPSVPPDRLNDLGWEIYPEGLYGMTKKTWERYRIPIMITENGICDASDDKRGKFIVDHLAQLARAIDEGAKVTRYFHWSFLDNLEWNEGYGPRFGLVEIDYTTMERKPRKSALAYAEICRTHRAAAGEGGTR